MTITASLVKELREKTNVGMMECKKALVEVGGDIDKAVKYLREKGLASASKKSERATKEGIVFIALNDAKNNGAIVELNCETDFVANNDDFRTLGNKVAQHILATDSIEKTEDVDDSQIEGQTFKVFLSESILKLGENITVGSFQKVQTPGTLASYVHMNGKIGVLLNVEGAIDEELSRDIAMHIAASQPEFVSTDQVPESRINEEKDVLKNQMLNEGKPEAILDKIIAGKISKFCTTICLLEQDFVKDSDKKVKQLLGDGTSIKQFIRLSI